MTNRVVADRHRQIILFDHTAIGHDERFPFDILLRRAHLGNPPQETVRPDKASRRAFEQFSHRHASQRIGRDIELQQAAQRRVRLLNIAAGVFQHDGGVDLIDQQQQAHAVRLGLIQRPPQFRGLA